MKLKGSILLVLSILLTACGNANTTVSPRHPGQEIVFQVVEGSFTYLKIEGTDPDAQWKTWQTPSKTEQSLVKTDEYWWAGTVVLTFDVVNDVRHRCVIDNLLEDPISDIAVIRYFKGKGCTGEGGSAREIGEKEVLFEYMEGPDGLKILDEADKAYSGLGCVTGIVDGFAKGLWGKVMVITDCVGASMSVINEILSRYKLQVTDKPMPTEPPVAEPTGIERIAGVWRGTVTGGGETGAIPPNDIELEIIAVCETGEPCLTIYEQIYPLSVIDENHICFSNFVVSGQDFISGDYQACFTLNEDGSLSYEAIILPEGNAKGTLYRSTK